MKFVSQKAVLSDAIGIASRAVSSKNAIPALEGILIDCREDGLILTSYNLEIGIVTRCGATVEEEGRTVVSAKLISDIIHKLPDEDVIFQTESDSICRIQCGPVEFSIPLIDPSEFPDIPAIEGTTSFSIPQGLLKNMIDKTIFAVAQTDIKPILTGLYFDIKNGILNIVAIDNYRMALRKENILTINGESKDFDFILPGNTARELEKILDDTDEPVSVFLSDKKICFRLAETTVVSRLLEGKYYDYASFIPQKGSIVAAFSKKRLSDAAERVSLIINERLRSHIRFTLSGNAARLSCSSTLGSASDEILLDSTYDKFEIGFNNRIFIDAIKAVDEENIILELSSSILPCVVIPEGNDSYIQIIMPVRLKN